MMDDVLVSEELAYGCTGIMTAIAANGLAVSDFSFPHIVQLFLSLFTDSLAHLLSPLSHSLLPLSCSVLSLSLTRSKPQFW